MNNLLKIFYEPSEVFESIPAKSRWYLPFISTMLLSCLISALVFNSIGMENLLRKQLRSQPGLVERLGEEQIEEIIQQSNSPGRQISAYLGGILSVGIVIPLIAVILTGLLSLLGAEPTFRNVFSVTAYSYYAYYFATLALSAPALFLISDKSNLEVDNILQCHLGIFFDRGTTNKALFSVATSIDLLSFWLLFMLALGLSKVSRRMTFTKSVATVAGLWFVYVAAKAGISALF